MKVLSLFDGMSCGRIALDRAGIKVDKYLASEIDPHAIKVSQANWDDITHIGSVLDLSDDQVLNMGHIDMIIGGSPCQGFSVAGSMKGSSTKEGVDVVSLDQYLQLKFDGFEFDGQSYLFWEYVRIWHLLRSVNPDITFFLENVRITKKWAPMFNSAMGVEPVVINSDLVSAQNRVRYYWTNIPNVSQPDDLGLVLSDVLDGEAPSKFSLSDKAVGYMGRLRNNKPRWEYHTNPLDGKAACLTANMYKGVPYGVIKAKMRRLTPTECEKLQTVPVGYTDCVSDTQRYKMLGNGWTVDVIAHMFTNLC